MRHLVVTYYSDGTEQVNDAKDEESAKVDYLLQLDAMRAGDHIERVCIAQVTWDSGPTNERG
jgi:hypothetical protein